MWRAAFQSEEIGKIRAREGLSGDWLFVLTCQEPFSWQAYDPVADRWHPLPPAPGFDTLPPLPLAVRCAILNHCLLVIITYHVSVSDVFLEPFNAKEKPRSCMLRFDPFFRKWSELPDMKTPHTTFACAVIDGRVLIASGGTTLAECFDPKKNAWEALPNMPEALYECEAITLNKRFHVLDFIANGTRRHFILNSNEWNLAPQTQQLTSLLQMKKTVNDEQLYGILKEGLAKFDGNMKEWKIFSEPPYLGVSDLEQCFPMSHGFMELNGRFYLVGGIKTFYNYFGEDFADISTVRYCDPSAGFSLYWHDARPLLGCGGRVLACAALRQE